MKNLIHGKHMHKILTVAFLVFSASLIGLSPQNAHAETISFGADGNMFAPNCFCKEDVIPYKLPGWCGSNNTCNGESDTHTGNVPDGDYNVTVNLGSLTDYQLFEVVIISINGTDYTVPDQGGNGSSTGTASYDLGTMHLSGTVTVKAKHKYADTFTGLWYSDQVIRLSGGIESIDVQSIVFDALTPPTPPTNGACGNSSASYPATDSAWPTNTVFCNTGSADPVNPVFPIQGGTSSWTCYGSNGGTNATCQATRAVEPTNAACGTRSASYSSATTDWPANTTFCTTGSSTPENPVFPSLGGTTSWTCLGSNNGTDVTCQANRNPESKKDNDDDCKGEIGNYVWLDSDGDGVQDDSEKGLDGVHVKLTFDNKTYRTKTNKKGRYSFEDLCKGDYIVTVKDEDVSGYTQTYDPDDTKNNKTDVELKNNHDSHMSADFGYRGRKVAPATGSGKVSIYVSILLTLVTFITYKKIRTRKLSLGR